jgi:hypothetical protein
MSDGACALVGSDESDPLRWETRDRRARLRQAIRERLERALAEGDLPVRPDPEALARYIVAVMRPPRSSQTEPTVPPTGEADKPLADLFECRTKSSRAWQAR